MRVKLADRKFYQAYDLGEKVGEHDGVEIYEARLTVEARRSQRWYEASVLAYEPSSQSFVGMAVLYRVQIGSGGTGLEIAPESACASDLREMSVRHGVDGKRALVVGSSHITSSHRGRGLGVALYVAAAAMARKLGLALVADRCTHEGRTSPDAERVWASRAFRTLVEVASESGLVGVYR